jgi:hypothetical protein
MKNIVIPIIVIAGIAAAGATSTLMPSRITGKDVKVSDEIIKKCDALAKVECGKSCKDGWQITGYYDPKSAAEEKKGPVIKAIQTVGVCKRCYIRFTLLENGGPREVTCEEFFQYLEKEKGRLAPATLSEM